MNRRNFFKLLGTVCGAAIVCPAELLKAEQPVYRIEKFCDFDVFPSEADRLAFRKAFREHQFKPPVSKNTKIVIIYDEFAKPCDFVFFKKKYNDKKTHS